MQSAVDRIWPLDRAREVRQWPGVRRSGSLAGDHTASIRMVAITRAGFTDTGTVTATRPGDGVDATGVAGVVGAGVWAASAGLGRCGLGWGLSVLGLWLGALRHGLHALQQRVLCRRIRSWPCLTTMRSRSTRRVRPAAESAADPAMTLFDAGRGLFHDGNYADALQKTDEALTRLPNDTTLHEFRALCLFALGRYDEAAATLYAVLSVGPGWDWTTLISLYPNVDVYTTQLRALEDYCKAQRQAAGARFVLAYHYLTEGFTDEAVKILKQVAVLKPNDTLTAKLLKQLDAQRNAGATAAATAVDTTPPAGATIEGTWTAQPAEGTSIALSIKPGGAFDWEVTQQGRKQHFAGTSTFGNGILTLAQEKGPALVGRVSWKDPSHMTFRIVGDGPDDPGLSFAK